MAAKQDHIHELEKRLDDFNPQVRFNSLLELKALMDEGKIIPQKMQPIANLHCHTFFSYNAYGYSPTKLAWIAKRMGIKYIGIVDFDVIDGVDEFLQACEIICVRGSAGIETRVYIPEFSKLVINSPGEPGISYHMGIGFTSSQAPESVAGMLNEFRQRADLRNRSMMRRLNDYLHPLHIDYDSEVLPSTPASTATERHMIAKIVQKAQETLPSPIDFWVEKLKTDRNTIIQKNEKPQVFKNFARAKLMKRGGIGYVQLKPELFPIVEDFHHVIEECGALPCATWLDGTSQGEQAIEDLLGLLIEKGLAAINIIPDRNWDIDDPEIKKVKLKNLYQVVELADKLNLPINIGTEMNSFGQKLVDDFNVKELAPVRDSFLRGADFIYGHMQMGRNLKMGYQSVWAKKYLPSRRERNVFFEEAGKAIPPDKKGRAILGQINASQSPAVILEKLKSNL